MGHRWAALVVDVQGDFTEWKGGSLAVPDTGEGYVRRVERATAMLKEAGLPVFGSQDWHPPDHVSFATNHPGRKPFETIVIDGRRQVLWPPHCVQGTEESAVLVDNSLFSAIVRKAQDPAFDSYSAFRDDGGRKTGLDGLLRANGIDSLIVFGLATDYCVQATATDGVDAGYRVWVVKGLIRGIAAESTAAAIERMEAAGIRMVDTAEEALEAIAEE